MDNEFIVRLLTIGSLAGLLLAVGMKLNIEQVLEALRKRRLTLIVIANFAIVPAIVLAVTEFCAFLTEISIGMILLAAAPFAPVVPVVAGMARDTFHWPAGIGGDGGRWRDILAAGLFAGWTGCRFTTSDWIRHE